MKTKLLFIVYWITLTCYAIDSNAQANQKLSNLITPTAVNQSLLPGTNNTINLGNSSLRWKNLYLENALYLKASITVHAPGEGNFFAGTNAGIFVTGNSNTGTGSFALFHVTSGSRNTANGYSSLFSNTTGFYNVASGYASLNSNTTGYANTANGYQSLFYNTSGVYNTASGHRSLYSNITGHWNTASGANALYSNTEGSQNTASGDGSLGRNTTGSGNTASGYASLYFNTIGDYNTACGYHALSSNTTGHHNTAVGYHADIARGDFSNATAIGYSALVNASNRVHIGNIAVTSIGGYVGWSIFSDGRYKRDIKENVQGLAFINSLRPITYTVNVQGLNEYYNKGRKQVEDNAIADNEDEAVNAEMKKAEEAASKIVYNGFIAQEVEEAAKKLNFEFSGVDKPQSKDGVYGLRYDNFVVPIVKAVQELSRQNDQLKKQNKELKARLDKIEAMLLKPHSDNAELGITAKLEQNIPNPFNNTTIIHYFLPINKGNAYINFYSSNGALLKSVKLAGIGKGTINIKANELPSGVYKYVLLVDGKVVDSKQMIQAE